MKRIIIFGASSGIGKMLAQMYAKEGNMVVASARREENLVALQGEFPNNIVAHAADVTAADVRETFYFMVERLSGADLVIYCSGMGKQNAAFDMGIEHSTIDVNVKGFTELAAAVVEYGSKVQHHVHSLKKKFKDKKFAAGCSRDVIKEGADRLGWTLDEVLDKTILAMRSCEASIAEETEKLCG